MEGLNLVVRFFLCVIKRGTFIWDRETSYELRSVYPDVLIMHLRMIINTMMPSSDATHDSRKPFHSPFLCRVRKKYIAASISPAVVSLNPNFSTRKVGVHVRNAVATKLAQRN